MKSRFVYTSIIVAIVAMFGAFSGFAKNHGGRPHPSPSPSPSASPGQNNLTFSLADLSGTYTFRLVPAVSFAPFYNGANGSPDSGVNSAPRQDILRVGTLTFNGNGNVTGHVLATTDNGLTTVALDFTVTGTYTVNPDGTGTLTLTPNGGTTTVPNEGTVEGTETYNIVINRSHGGTIQLAETDNDGGGAKIFLTGEAVSRSSAHGEEGDEGDDD